MYCFLTYKQRTLEKKKTKVISFAITTKNNMPKNKCRKDVKDLHIENHKALLKELEKYKKKWKYIPWSRTGIIKIVKMSLLLRAIYRFNAIPIKSQCHFLKEIDQKSSGLYEPQVTSNT